MSNTIYQVIIVCVFICLQFGAVKFGKYLAKREFEKNLRVSPNNKVVNCGELPNFEKDYHKSPSQLQYESLPERIRNDNDSGW